MWKWDCSGHSAESSYMWMERHRWYYTCFNLTSWEHDNTVIGLIFLVLKELLLRLPQSMVRARQWSYTLWCWGTYMLTHLSAYMSGCSLSTLGLTLFASYKLLFVSHKVCLVGSLKSTLLEKIWKNVQIRNHEIEGLIVLKWNWGFTTLVSAPQSIIIDGKSSFIDNSFERNLFR